MKSVPAYGKLTTADRCTLVLANIPSRPERSSVSKGNVC